MPADSVQTVVLKIRPQLRCHCLVMSRENDTTPRVIIAVNSMNLKTVVLFNTRNRNRVMANTTCCCAICCEMSLFVIRDLD